MWSLAERLARTRRACVASLERELVELVREAGPLTSPELRRLLGLGDARAVKRAPERLQARLVLTQAGEAPQEHGWDANVYDLVQRRFPLRRLPQPDMARRQLVELVLRAADEVSAADVAAALPLTRRDAERELELITKNGDARRLDETLYAPAA